MTKKTHAPACSFNILFFATHHFLFVLCEITFKLFFIVRAVYWSQKIFQANKCSTLTSWESYTGGG